MASLLVCNSEVLFTITFPACAKCTSTIFFYFKLKLFDVQNTHFMGANITWSVHRLSTLCFFVFFYLFLFLLQAGDRVEISAMKVLYGNRNTPLLIGSVKSNIGHTEATSGKLS